MFLTITVTGTNTDYKGPGQYDPIVNTKIQAALQKLADGAWFKKAKDRIAVVINALQATYDRMTIAGSCAWWDNVHFKENLPDRVSNFCNKNLGSPDPLECERASFNFIRSGSTPGITSRKPIVIKYGKC